MGLGQGFQNFTSSHAAYNRRYILRRLELHFWSGKINQPNLYAQEVGTNAFQ